MRSKTICSLDFNPNNKTSFQIHFAATLDNHTRRRVPRGPSPVVPYRNSRFREVPTLIKRRPQTLEKRDNGEVQ
ncbi:hypothetical protein IscW_ISCW013651 [Ixodes scapularis]|uniref:Uncharacterized protein n=1 Tax=Ixodes scapularis TaxID=6945 RepID=B7QK05_IXOSC|nr:hypothetical protein IscW_ISCW013651 [Ixodes scapularis]|eukprot:XP_002415512.1 hypothetical protein IscW_ISCW013651 [Ixodes scapularis]